jgi:hypothetical protein
MIVLDEAETFRLVHIEPFFRRWRFKRIIAFHHGTSCLEFLGHHSQRWP